MTHPDLRDDQLLHRLPAIYLDQYILECGPQRIRELDQIVGRKLAIKRDLANIISLGRQCTLDLWVLPEAKRTDVDKPNLEPNHSPGMDTERDLPAAAAMSGQSELPESSSTQPVLKIIEDLSPLNQSSKPSRIEKRSLPASTNLLGYSAPDYLAEKGVNSHEPDDHDVSC